MITLQTNSVAETEAFGEQLGLSASSGMVLGLSGDLGAGKTAFVRGFARGLGYSGRVHSPTFGLINHYEGGRLPLFHLDLYRLETPEEIRAAGLEDYLVQPAGVSVVEWIERWCGDALASADGAGGFRRVYLQSVGDQIRNIAYDNAGT